MYPGNSMFQYLSPRTPAGRIHRLDSGGFLSPPPTTAFLCAWYACLPPTHERNAFLIRWPAHQRWRPTTTPAARTYWRSLLSRDMRKNDNLVESGYHLARMCVVHNDDARKLLVLTGTRPEWGLFACFVCMVAHRGAFVANFQVVKRLKTGSSIRVLVSTAVVMGRGVGS